MKLLTFCAITFYCVILSGSRLILRTTDKPKGVMIANSNIKDISSSKEDIDGPEIIHYYNGKVRLPRQDDSTETKNITRKNTDTQGNSKTPLVKKPIPKYKDADSDEDYLSKHIKTRMPSKLAESVEHEDEDFSLDDYDFDVNHDEFIGRGKPLEPRKELRRLEASKTKSAQKAKRNLIKSRVLNAEQNNLERITRKIENKQKEDDYDDDFSTTVSSIVVETTPINREEDSSDERESSNEGKVFIRNERSPWSIDSYVDKLGEKTSTIMTKALSFLPLFPQIPEFRRIDTMN